jgi:hypothetical protein
VYAVTAMQAMDLKSSLEIGDGQISLELADTLHSEGKPCVRAMVVLPERLRRDWREREAGYVARLFTAAFRTRGWGLITRLLGLKLACV